jgi:hypothetical protein
MRYFAELNNIMFEVSQETYSNQKNLQTALGYTVYMCGYCDNESIEFNYFTFEEFKNNLPKAMRILYKTQNMYDYIFKHSKKK